MRRYTMLARRVVRQLRLQLARVRPRRLPGSPDALGPSVRVHAPVEGTFGPDVPVDVVAYYPDPPDNLYQLRQWLPILTRVAEGARVALVCRHPATFVTLVDETSLPVVLIRYLRDLDAFYEVRDVKVCLYVNNHHLNFQSLTFTDQLHVHINHGESDKISMASHQARAYDRVLVAGPAAVERYRTALLEPDAAHLIEVGRPQLDLLPPHHPSPDGRLRVVYAPTWEGGRDLMDYSSVAAMGEGIVARLLTAGFRVTYRPHPKVGSRREDAARAHRAILARLAAEGKRAPAAGHRVSRAEPLGEVLAEADVLIADVSSVTHDFLPTGRPFLITDPPSDGGQTSTASEVQAAGYPLAPEQLPEVASLIRGIVDDDPRRAPRAVLATRFFGDTDRGAATRRFLEAIDGIVADRERLVAAKRARLRD